MDALEFLIERKRMCKSHNACKRCPLERGICGLGTYISDEDYKRIITVIEKWSKEHPHKTRQSEFLKQWPEAAIDENGCLILCPLMLSAAKRNKHTECTTLKCTDCRREFWMQEKKGE